MSEVFLVDVLNFVVFVETECDACSAEYLKGMSCESLDDEIDTVHFYKFNEE